MHPSESARFTSSRALEGRRVVLGITGSIAAVESFALARELVRHGADVVPVLTESACQLVTPAAMEFATGNEAVTELDGRTQHVALLGEHERKADLLLIAPCTANTISKMALGIDDTTVTTMATVALGSKVPIIAAPAMHLAMYEGPAVRRNVETLRGFGVTFVGPHVMGRKARAASTQEIVHEVMRALGPNDLKGRSVLVIGGSSEEPIDDVRTVTNVSTGETAVQMAVAAYERGADVRMWTGRMEARAPAFVQATSFRTVSDLVRLVNLEKRLDIVLVPAALSDYAPVRAPGKISSSLDSLDVHMVSVPKVLPLLRPISKTLIGFKAETGTGPEELAARARGRLEEHSLDAIVANDLRDVAPGRTVATIIPRAGAEIGFEGSKRELADRVLDAALQA